MKNSLNLTMIPITQEEHDEADNQHVIIRKAGCSNTEYDD